MYEKPQKQRSVNMKTLQWNLEELSTEEQILEMAFSYRELPGSSSNSAPQGEEATAQ